MIVILKDGTKEEQIGKLQKYFEGMGLRIHMSKGENSTIMGLVGDTTRVDAELIASLDAVKAVRRIQEPYKKANRKFHPEDTVIDVNGVKIGGGHFQIIAGPCSVESENADDNGRQGGEGGWRNAAARRRIQAPYLTLRVSGPA